MTTQEEIDALARRLKRAEFERDSWRAAGAEEKYLAAFVMVEALDVTMMALRQRRRSEQAADGAA